MGGGVFGKAGQTHPPSAVPFDQWVRVPASLCAVARWYGRRIALWRPTGSELLPSVLGMQVTPNCGICAALRQQWQPV